MKPQELEGSKTICNFMWFYYLSCSSRQPGHRTKHVAARSLLYYIEHGLSPTDPLVS
jgi:hypothetical protein